MKLTKCKGENCPIVGICLRARPPKDEKVLDFSPYDQRAEECAWFINGTQALYEWAQDGEWLTMRGDQSGGLIRAEPKEGRHLCVVTRHGSDRLSFRRRAHSLAEGQGMVEETIRRYDRTS